MWCRGRGRCRPRPRSSRQRSSRRRKPPPSRSRWCPILLRPKRTARTRTGSAWLRTPTSRRPRSRRLGDAVLNILAVFGVLCIVLTVVAFVGNYSIILFKTGSMDPTIPQGSAAVVHEIPAAQVKVGDIVTVDRGPGLKPITHRAISVTPIGGGRVEIEMQGDANPNPDPEPYRVSTVKKVLWHVPGLARQVVWLSHPYVLAAITLGAALLVLWTFWPKPSTGRRPDDA
ncbi:signal peptidase I [Gordonia paraffinivorans]|nr:signal peptidase I [Gordonia paraffinivorans]